MRIHPATVVMAAVVLGLPAGALAQQKYPAKSVRLVLPFAAGSAVDLLARLYAQRMTESWGQQIVVDNRTGANGIIGMEAIARSAPDGYTIGMANIATLAVNPSLYPKISYDTLRDFTPVSLTATIGNCLVVHPSFPVKSVKELVQAMTGMKLVHVVYKGVTPAFNDLVAGQVPIAFTGLAQSLPYYRSGRLRMLGTTGVKRTAATTDVPTIAEQNLPGYEADSWTGVVLPKGVPADVVAQIQAEIVRVTHLADTRERLIAAGFEPVGSTGEAFAALIRNDSARLGKVIR